MVRGGLCGFFTCWIGVYKGCCQSDIQHLKSLEGAVFFILSKTKHKREKVQGID